MSDPFLRDERGTSLMAATWIIGNVSIGAGAIIAFFYLLFSLFWANPLLTPWYLVFILTVFIVFNIVFIPKHTVFHWGRSLLLMIGSAFLTYALHLLVHAG